MENGGGGADRVAPEWSGAGALEGSGVIVVEGAAPEPNGTAAPQIQEANGDRKTCHQCRQKRDYFAAACKKMKKNGLCTLKYCQKCLLNRYGEVAEEVAQDEGWTCPKCRGKCNCSMCRKRNGEQPTGKLVHAAKASGCSAVHELLEKGQEEVDAALKLVTPLKMNGTEKSNPKRAPGADDGTDELSGKGDDLNGVSFAPANKKLKVNKKLKGNSKTALGTDDDTDELSTEGGDVNAHSSIPAKKRLKGSKRIANGSLADQRPQLRTESSVALKDEVILPRGTLVTRIAGAELEAEDVGPAIQFFEFCHKFGEVFQIKKGQPEKVLRDITVGRKLRVVSSFVAELHISLLSVIREGRGEKPLNYSRDGDEWIADVGKYINESKLISKELTIDCLNQGALGYSNLSSSFKLHVLNYLCDEALSSENVRDWIGKQIERVAERKNAAREKIRVAKEKVLSLEKELKERQNDMAKAMHLGEGEAASIEETKNLISEIKKAEEEKQAAVNELNTLEEEKKVGGVLRTKPVMVDKGVAYWKLNGCCDNTAIVSQEFDNAKPMGNTDRWFVFTEDEEKVIIDHAATKS